MGEKKKRPKYVPSEILKSDITNTQPRKSRYFCVVMLMDENLRL